MKIVSGKFGGLNLKAVPGNDTRPTSAKVKEAVFSMIGPYLQYGNSLDLFAGTGSLGIESVSRGYEKSYLVDKAYKAISTIKENVEKTNSRDQFQIIKSSATEALNKLHSDGVKFDLVFLDPPYRMKITEQIVKDMIEQEMIEEGGIFVVETDYEVTIEGIEKLSLIKMKDYKDTKVAIYQYGG
ncbi:16S rRNA (guanine(966)-N(2))-methyltransferase RsmD [Lactobacillus terrae]|uniref:16S rRNA (guanine(966)-N(2))-methyltransferase RsmD n=1 Tax=Lactobacillus terrae TaxID=2269374 RepID=UPI000C1B6EC8|nr:16S rRNA (guanine(966)-N(2))-methyltransferase RsmD [Lactobacillus terrae]